jgi:hypothetical protein
MKVVEIGTNICSEQELMRRKTRRVEHILICMRGRAGG